MASHSHSNRSPSPLSSSKHTNPNPRNSAEPNSAARRSFNGKPSLVTNPRRFDPNTPANSPLDFTRRSVSDCEKENENDVNSKHTKIRSSGKGTKHFMAPTISAASKVTPSPKKKILAERNDPLRASAFWCDGKAILFSSANSSQELDSNDLASDQSQALETSFNLNSVSEKMEDVVLETPLPISKPPKRVSFVEEVPSDSQPATESFSDSVVTDSSDNLNSEPIAPLDADPSLPPYDPTTKNYLSPRPQFLYYKPNPRIQALLNKEKGMDPDRLEGFEDRYLAELMSETFSDSEEESQSEAGSEKDEPEVAADMVLGLEEDLSDTIMPEPLELLSEVDRKSQVADCSTDEVLGLEETDNGHVSEPLESLSATPTVSDSVIAEKSAQESKKRPRSFWNLIRFSMLLMLLVGCASVCFTRPGSLNQLVDAGMTSFDDLSTYYHESNAPTVAKESLERLAKHVNELSANAIDLMSKLIKPSELKLSVPLKFMNVTDDLLQSNIWDERSFLSSSHDATSIVSIVGEGLDEYEEMVDSDEISAEDVVEDLYDELENDGDTNDEGGSDMEAYSDESEVDTQTDVLGNKAPTDSETSLPDVSETSADSEFDAELVSEILQPDVLENIATAESVMDAELESVSADSMMDSKSESDVQTDVALVSDNLLSVEGETSVVSDVSAEVELKVETEMVEEAVSETTTEAEGDELSAGELESNLVPYIIAASALFIALLPVGFLYSQKKKSLSKQVGSGFEVRTQQHILQKQSQQTEVEVPCPSQLSSSFRSSIYKTEDLRGETEAQSGGSKARRVSKRESLASSADYSGSPSYGSFTTLERIPIKHGEEELITPVRRSSRIRKQVTSP